MSRYQLTRRFCNPLGLKDAKYFGHRKTRLKRTRTEPLPGTKVLQPSEKDGKIQDLFVAKELKSESCSMTQILDWGSMVLAGITLILLVMGFFYGPGEGPYEAAIFALIGMHVGLFFSQCFAGFKNKRLWITLGVTYAACLIAIVVEVIR